MYNLKPCPRLEGHVFSIKLDLNICAHTPSQKLGVPLQDQKGRVEISIPGGKLTTSLLKFKLIFPVFGT